jgi:hypothetical protein
VLDTTTDVLLGEHRVAALAAGETFSSSVTLKLKTLPSGTYYAIAVVDPAGAIPEARETNNTAAAVVTLP